MGDVIMTLTHHGFVKAGETSRLIDARSQSLDQIKTEIEEFKPDVCLINNFDIFMIHSDGPQIEELLTQKGIALVSWFFESPELSGSSKLLFRWLKGPYPKNIHFLVTDSHFVDFFKIRGAGCEHLPLGIDSQILSKLNARIDHLTSPEALFFSGACMTSVVSSEQEPLLRLKHASQFILLEFQQFIGSQLPTQFLLEFQQVIENLFKNWKSIHPNYRLKRNDTINQLISEITNQDLKNAFIVYQSRIDIVFSFYQLYEILRLLSNDHPLSIQGSKDWELLKINTISTAKHLSQEELLSCFSKSLGVLCHTKHVFQNFVHERVPMTLAAGGLPITDKREDLNYFFKNAEIPTYSDVNEIPEILKFYKANPEKRSSLISQGQKQVFSLHTYDHRAKSIVDYIKKNGLVRSTGITSSQDTLSPSIQVPS